jgi:hypothetical protein
VRQSQYCYRDEEGHIRRTCTRSSNTVRRFPDCDQSKSPVGTGSLVGVERPECGVNHPSHLVPMLRKE